MTTATRTSVKRLIIAAIEVNEDRAEQAHQEISGVLDVMAKHAGGRHFIPVTNAAARGIEGIIETIPYIVDSYAESHTYFDALRPGDEVTWWDSALPGYRGAPVTSVTADERGVRTFTVEGWPEPLVEWAIISHGGIIGKYNVFDVSGRVLYPGE